MDSGFVLVFNVVCDKLGKRLREVSEPGHVARRRSYHGDAPRTLTEKGLFDVTQIGTACPFG